MLARLGPFGRAFSHHNYRVYFAGNALSLIGTWMQRIGIGWVAWELTGSSAWLGIVAFADLFPTVLVTIFAGVAVDRIGPMKVARVAQILQVVQALVLAGLVLFGWINIWLLIVLAAFQGTVTAFYQPARLSLIPLLVPREDLSAAIAINAINFNLARFIGPAIAGALIAAGGAQWTFAANALTYFAFFVSLLLLKIPDPAPRTTGKRSVLSEVGDGYRYAVRHPGIGPLLILVIITSTCLRAVFELMPAYADEMFHAGPEGLGMLTAATGAGAIVAGLWLGLRGSVQGLTRISLWGILGSCLSLTAFAATEILWVGMLSIGISGATLLMNGVGMQTLMQNAVTTEMRGRVMALYWMIFRGGPAFGALALGAASDLFGLHWPLIGACVLSLVAWAWCRKRLPHMAQALEAGPNT
ncbi:MAG: MFS transporter [Alphaproteobacteria bacterium]|nr:MFS transporter [Alphaproteobacteria bacterium]